jgi:hypothetical protein
MRAQKAGIGSQTQPATATRSAEGQGQSQTPGAQWPPLPSPPPPNPPESLRRRSRREGGKTRITSTSTMRACARGLGEASRVIWCDRQTRWLDSRKLSIVVSITGGVAELESFRRWRPRSVTLSATWICHEATVRVYPRIGPHKAFLPISSVLSIYYPYADHPICELGSVWEALGPSPAAMAAPAAAREARPPHRI